MHLETRGSNFLESIVSWSHTRSGATVASSDPVLESELGRVAEGRFRRYWDRSNIPQRKRRMKCGIMGNWRCSDRAKCPCLRTHSMGLPCSVVLNESVLHKLGAVLCTG